MRNVKNIYNILERYKKYMDINFEYYKIFYYVAKYRNITKAAAALGSNQPNVTRIMKLLETQLNCRLFIRESRGISLTREGELLYSHVEVAYRHLLNAQEEIGRQDFPGCGTVEIGATETALHLFLINALHDFKREYPGVRIKIHNHTTPDIMKKLISGRLDLAVITMSFQEILVGGTQFRELCGSPMELEEIKKYPWIGVGTGSATYELYKNFFIDHKIDVEPDMEVATSDLLIPLIKSNLGIGFVPEKMAMPLVEEGKLVQIPLRSGIPERSIQIVSDKGRARSLAADIFYRFLKSR